MTIIQGRTFYYSVGDGGPNFGALSFGNVQFRDVVIMDEGWRDPESKGSAWFKDEVADGFASIANEGVYFDEPVELDRSLHVLLLACRLSAPEGCVAFDIESAKVGGPLRFGFPKTTP